MIICYKRSYMKITRRNRRKEKRKKERRRGEGTRGGEGKKSLQSLSGIYGNEVLATSFSQPRHKVVGVKSSPLPRYLILSRTVLYTL